MYLLSYDGTLIEWCVNVPEYVPSSGQNLIYRQYSVWRPARTRWGELKRSPDPLAAIRGLLLRDGIKQRSGKSARTVKSYIIHEIWPIGSQENH